MLHNLIICESLSLIASYSYGTQITETSQIAKIQDLIENRAIIFTCEEISKHHTFISCLIINGQVLRRKWKSPQQGLIPFVCLGHLTSVTKSKRQLIKKMNLVSSRMIFPFVKVKFYMPGRGSTQLLRSSITPTVDCN